MGWQISRLLHGNRHQQSEPAVASAFARRGLGSILLADAVKKTMAAARTGAMTVVIVDPIDDAARAFYGTFGFRSLQGQRQQMFLTMPRAS